MMTATTCRSMRQQRISIVLTVVVTSFVIFLSNNVEIYYSLVSRCSPMTTSLPKTTIATNDSERVVDSNLDDVVDDNPSTSTIQLPNVRYQIGSWIGNIWIPPPGWRLFSTVELQNLWGDKNLLWVGDSQGRRTSLALYQILNVTTRVPFRGDGTISESNSSSESNSNITDEALTAAAIDESVPTGNRKKMRRLQTLDNAPEQQHDPATIVLDKIWANQATNDQRKQPDDTYRLVRHDVHRQPLDDFYTIDVNLLRESGFTHEPCVWNIKNAELFPYIICRYMPTHNNRRFNSSDANMNDPPVVPHNDSLPNNTTTNNENSNDASVTNSNDQFQQHNSSGINFLNKLFFNVWRPHLWDVFDFFYKEANGVTNILDNIDIVVVSIGVWNAYGVHHNIVENKERLIDDYDIDWYRKSINESAKLATSNRTIIWRTTGYHHFPDIIETVYERNENMMNIIDEYNILYQQTNNNRSSNLTYVDWGSAIASRAFGNDRIHAEDQAPAHFGAEPRIVLIQMITNHLIDRQTLSLTI